MIDPYGRITAEGGINERGVIVGETFIASRRTLYTRLGDGFGWAMVLASLGLALRVMLDWVDERTASRL